MLDESIFSQTMARLRLALKVETDLALAEALGMKPSAFANRKKSGSLPYDELLNLAKSRNLNLHWLLTGEEPAPMKELPEPIANDPLAQQKAQVKALVDRLDDPRKLSAVQDSIEESERVKRMEKELAEFRQRAG